MERERRRRKRFGESAREREGHLKSEQERCRLLRELARERKGDLESERKRRTRRLLGELAIGRGRGTWSLSKNGEDADYWVSWQGRGRGVCSLSANGEGVNWQWRGEVFGTRLITQIFAEYTPSSSSRSTYTRSRLPHNVLVHR